MYHTLINRLIQDSLKHLCALSAKAGFLTVFEREIPSSLFLSLKCQFKNKTIQKSYTTHLHLSLLFSFYLAVIMNEVLFMFTALK